MRAQLEESVEIDAGIVGRFRRRKKVRNPLFGQIEHVRAPASRKEGVPSAIRNLDRPEKRTPGSYAGVFHVLFQSFPGMRIQFVFENVRVVFELHGFGVEDEKSRRMPYGADEGPIVEVERPMARETVSGRMGKTSGFDESAIGKEIETVDDRGSEIRDGPAPHVGIEIMAGDEDPFSD